MPNSPAQCSDFDIVALNVPMSDEVGPLNCEPAVLVDKELVELAKEEQHHSNWVLRNIRRVSKSLGVTFDGLKQHTLFY